MKLLAGLLLIFTFNSYGETKKEWFKKEFVWRKGREFSLGTYREDKKNLTKKNISKLIQFAGFKQGGFILDLGSGEGLHSAFLAKHGFQIECLDYSEHMLSVAKENFSVFKQKALFTQADMLDLNKEKTYDAILNFGYSFGYFDTPEKNMRVLKNIYKSLKKEGKFFIEIWGKEMIDRVYPKTLVKQKGEETLLRIVKISDSYNKLHSYVYYINEDKIQFYKQDVYLYSAKELTDMLKEVGFKIVGVYGNYNQGPYDHTAENLLILAEK